MIFYQKSIVENLFNSMADIDQNYVWHVFIRVVLVIFFLTLSVTLYVLSSTEGMGDTHTHTLSTLFSSTMIYRCFLSLLSLLKKVVNPLPVYLLKFLYFSFLGGSRDHGYWGKIYDDSKLIIFQWNIFK